MQTQHSYSTTSFGNTTTMLRAPGAFVPGSSDSWNQADLNERERLDHLFILALTDEHVHNQLLSQHDPSLLDSFGLSEETKHMFADFKGNTLEEYAQAIVAASVPYRAKPATARR